MQTLAEQRYFELAAACRVFVNAGVTTDIVGNPNSAASTTYTFAPTSLRYATTAKTVNGVFGGAMAATAGTTIVASSIGAPLLLLHMP